MKIRIISGQYGGRLISTPPGHKTHPMSEKMRGALFNALGDIAGLTVLDAYAGSGAIAIEAVSRGASTVVAIDKDKAAFETIKSNVASLSIESIKISRANISSWLDTNPDASFDIAICDPPYDQLNIETLNQIARFTQRVIVVSAPPTYNEAMVGTFTLHTQKSYGDGNLFLYTH